MYKSVQQDRPLKEILGVSAAGKIRLTEKSATELYENELFVEHIRNVVMHADHILEIENNWLRSKRNMPAEV